ncbi:MAG: ABC transporter six-transmembrane domain-containing protein [Proteobacteria bacterium]|nr:ABC transporter six-transmembrane domain-containing protein [Pseudomonadota bacterium]
MQGILDVGLLFRYYRWPVVGTWLLLLLENTLLALIPLFIGRAIDALLGSEAGALWEIAAVMTALIAVASARRAYDTRCYGTMRVRLGAEVVRRIGDRPVSQVNARLDMSREMVDFLEGHVPELLTAVVQVVVSMAILWTFDRRLGLSALLVVAGVAVVYALFHRRFYRLNGDLNAQVEQQVAVIEQRQTASLLAHLKRLRRCEIRLSDTEVFLYGGIFVGMFAFVLANLWFASTLPAVSAGTIFAILSYSWELVGSGITLPIVLQQWSRLSEIRERLNEATAGALPGDRQ